MYMQLRALTNTCMLTYMCGNHHKHAHTCTYYIVSGTNVVMCDYRYYRDTRDVL